MTSPWLHGGHNPTPMAFQISQNAARFGGEQTLQKFNMALAGQPCATETFPQILRLHGTL